MNSPAYKGLQPEKQQKVNDLIYKKYSDELKFTGRAAPGKGWWDAQKPEDKIKTIRNTSPLSADYGNVSFETADKYALAKFKESAAQIVQNGLKYASGTSYLGLGGGLPDILHAVAKPLSDAMEPYTARKVADVHHLEPLINSSMAAQTYGGATGLLPDLIALYAGPSGELAGINRTEKGLELTGAIARAGGVTKYIESMGAPGRTLLRMANGAIDGFYLGTLHGEPIEERAKSAASWAGFEAVGGPILDKAEQVLFPKGAASAVEEATKTVAPSAIPEETPNISKVFRGGTQEFNNHVSTTYSKLSHILGPDFVKSTVDKTMTGGVQTAESFPKEPSEFWGVSKNDPLVRKLDMLNEHVLNRYAREFYNQDYNELARAQKREVNKEITKSIVNGYRYPAIFDPEATAVRFRSDLRNAASSDPIVGQNINKLQAVTKALTGSPEMKDALKDITDRTKIVAGVTRSPLEKLKDLNKANTIEEVATALKKENPVRPLEPFVKPPREGVVPGAASKFSPEFTEDAFMRSLSLNEYVESPEDRLAIEYWKATTGRIKDPRLKNKIIRAYEATVPDAEQRVGHVQGIIEHYDKLFHTGHLGQKENVYRSGNYMVDELRDKYDLPKTEWQHQLDQEYKQATKPKTKDYIPKSLDKYRQSTSVTVPGLSQPVSMPVAEYRKLPSGEHVVYIDPRGMAMIQMAFGKDPAKLPLGFSVGPSDLQLTTNALADLSGRLPLGPLRNVANKLTSVMLKAESNLGPADFRGVAFALTHDFDPTGTQGIVPIPKSEIIKTLREEFHHGWQRELGRGSTLLHLSPSQYDDLEKALPPLAKLTMQWTGYSSEKSEMVIEAAAKIMSGTHMDDMSMSDEEATNWLASYFDTVIQKHGDAALSSIQHIMGISKKVLSEAQERTKGIIKPSEDIETWKRTHLSRFP